MEQLLIEGHFWLPGQPDNRVAGRLAFDPVEGSDLSLIGALDETHNVSRIVGMASDGAYTLDDCFLKRSNISFIEKQIFHVGRIYGGVEYEQNENPIFDEFRIGMETLIEWVQPPHIEEDIHIGLDANGREHPYKITTEPFDTKTIAMPDGNLALQHIRGFDGDGLNRRRLTQALSLNLTLTKALPAADILDIASDLQDLVSIGTNRVAAYTFTHLYHEDLTTEGVNGARYPEPARLLVPWLAQPDRKKSDLNTYNMAFTFDELGGMAGIAKWLRTAADYRSMLGRVMSTRYVRMFVEDRFMHRVVALEGLHHTWKGTKNTPMRTRLTQLGQLAGDPFSQLVPDVTAWCNKAKDERDNLAHHYGRTIHQDGTELLYSSEIAYWLFVLCMLRLADAPEIVFAHIAKNPDFTWLQGRMT